MPMGRQPIALPGLRVDGGPRAVAESLPRHDEVVYAVLTAGTFDLLVELV